MFEPSVSYAVRVLTLQDYRLVPWVNGPGTTTEMVCFPPGSRFPHNSIWRISSAPVNEDGPFSHLPDYERVILLLEGRGMTLRHSSGVPVVIDQPLIPHSFSGAEETHCTLLGGPLRDFNVMTRRGRASADVSVHHFVPGETKEYLFEGAAHVLYCVEGVLQISIAGADPLQVHKGETLLWERQAPASEKIGGQITASENASVIGVRILYPDFEETWKEFEARVHLVDQALKELPHLLGEKGWTKFWNAVQSLPVSALPGFLAVHRQYLPASRLILSMVDKRFAAYPAPVNTAVGFASLAAFLKLSKWDYLRGLVEKVKNDYRAVVERKDQATARFLQKMINDIHEKIRHPRIVNSDTDFTSAIKSQGSFEASLQAFQSLLMEEGKASFEVVFEHPGFLWMESARMNQESRNPNHGKWIVPCVSLKEATAVARKLIPDFENGCLTCAKFLVATTELGGVYLLVYSLDQNEERRQILETASNQTPFFVYDNDCYEMEALGQALQSINDQIGFSDVRSAQDNLEAYAIRLAKPKFGEEMGLSTIQCDVIRAVLQMHPGANPAERANYLAVTYFGNWKETMAVMLPKMFDFGNRRQIQVQIARVRRATRERMKK